MRADGREGRGGARRRARGARVVRQRDAGRRRRRRARARVGRGGARRLPRGAAGPPAGRARCAVLAARCAHGLDAGVGRCCSRWRWSATLAGASRAVAEPLYLASMAVGGWPIARAALAGLRRRLAGHERPDDAGRASARSGIGAYAEGAWVLVLFAVGTTLETYAFDRSRRSVTELMELAPAAGARRRRRRQRAARCRSRRSPSARASSCARASASRSTARSSPAPRASTRRRSPASRSRSTSSRAARCSPARSTPRAR